MSLRMDYSDFHPDVPEEAFRDAAFIATMRAAEHVKSVSQELAPVETGNLVGSAEARPSDDGGAEVYYPGPYARYQHYGPHWDPEVLHHEHGQGLYLEGPMVTEASKVQQIYADALREAGFSG